MTKGVALLDFMGLAGKKAGALSKGMRWPPAAVLALARSADAGAAGRTAVGHRSPVRSRIVDAILSEYRAGRQTISDSTHEVLETEALFEKLVLLKSGTVKLQGDAERLRAEFGRSVQGIMEEVFA